MDERSGGAQLNAAADANPRRVSPSLLLCRVRVGAAERQAVSRLEDTVSWDIFVQHLPDEAQTLAEIPDDYVPPPIGSRDSVISRIREAIPDADFSDPSWGLIDGPNFSIEVSLRAENLNGFALHVRGDDSVVPVVATILAATGLRGIDSGTGEIFDESAAGESLQCWRAYRDQVADGSGG